MPTIVDFPTIVQEALTIVGDVFDTEAARRHFADALIGFRGLMLHHGPRSAPPY